MTEPPASSLAAVPGALQASESASERVPDGPCRPNGESGTERVPDGPSRSYEDRKRRGAWYTPLDLARRMVGRALGYVDGPVRHVLDPCAGGGVFLQAAAEHGLAAYGVDADPEALGAAQAAVPSARCVTGDALLAPAMGGIDWEAAFPDALGAGGFDMVVGNPPWEVLERSVHAPHQGGPEYAARLRQSGYRSQRSGFGAGGKINLFRLAVERGFGLLRPGGVLAFLVPAGLLRDAGSTELRKFLLAEGSWEEVWELESSNDLFPSAHRALPVCAVFIRRGGPTAAVRLPGGTIGADLIRRFSPRDMVVPALRRTGDADILARLLPLGRLEDAVPGIRKGDVNLATDRSMFTTEPTALELRTGKEIAPYRVAEPPTRWVDPVAFRARRDTDSLRVAWRDIADITLKKRMCAAPLGPGTVLGDTLNFLELAGRGAATRPDGRDPDYLSREIEVFFWMAVLNSHVFEWLVRMRSAHNHLGQNVVGPCPVPAFDPRSEHCLAVVEAAREAGTSAARATRADALLAGLYGLDAETLEAVLMAFPKQPAASREALIQAATGVQA